MGSNCCLTSKSSYRYQEIIYTNADKSSLVSFVQVNVIVYVNGFSGGLRLMNVENFWFCICNSSND